MSCAVALRKEGSVEHVLSSTHDEVLRRLGRNLLLYQQIEHLLKILLISHPLEGAPADISTYLEKRKCQFGKQMLGLLVEQFSAEILVDAGAPPLADRSWEDSLSTLHVSSTLRLAMESDRLAEYRRDLVAMTQERNELVHHFVQRWEHGSPSALEEALRYLDVQWAKAMPIFEHLKATLDVLRDAGKHVAAFVASPEFALASSPLMAVLNDTIVQRARPDGWTYLADAGRRAALEMEGEIRQLRERCQCRTLRQLVEASGMFELFDEPLENGSFRTLYRARLMQ